MMSHSVPHCQQCPIRCLNPLEILSEKQLERFSDRKTNRVYYPGQQLFHAGSQIHGVHCVEKGQLKLTKYSNDGKAYITRLAKAGDLLGYGGLLADEPYSDTATVLATASICFIGRELFLQTLREEPELTLHLLQLLGKELQRADTQGRDLAFYSVFERTAKQLLLMKQSFGQVLSDGSSLLDVSLSREEWAGLIGTTVETLVRTFTYLKQKQLIAYKNKKIILKDIPGLVSLIPKGDPGPKY